MNLYQIKSLSTAETSFFFLYTSIFCIIFLILAAISFFFLFNFSPRLHSRPAFLDATPDLLLKRASPRNSLKVILSFRSYTVSTFFFFFAPLLFRFLLSSLPPFSISLSKLASLDES